MSGSGLKLPVRTEAEARAELERARLNLPPALPRNITTGVPMMPHEVWGPWAGLHSKPPVPLSVKRQRNKTRAIAVVLGILAIVTGVLVGLSNWHVPQI